MAISGRRGGLAIALLLCLSCGKTERKATPANAESSGTGWTFGDDLNTVISSPVEGADGLVYVAVGSRRVARGNPEGPAPPYSDQALFEIRVIALDPSGIVRWRSVPTCNPMSVVATEYATLAASPNGDALVVCNREAVRVDSKGGVKWRAEVGTPRAAVGEDGVVYAFVRTGDAYSLSAFDVSGRTKWTSTELLTAGSGDLNVGTQLGLQTSAIVGRDAVYAPCDRCGDNQMGMARIELGDGETTLVGGIDGTPGTFGSLAAGVGDDLYITVGLSLMTYSNRQVRVSSDQSLMASGLSPVLVAKEGPVYMSSDDGYRLHIGDRLTRPLAAGALVYGPMALVAPRLVLLGNGQIIDYDGREVFTIEGVDVAKYPPLIRNGALLVTTKTGQLQRRELPIQGLEPDAPWPVIGGDGSNAHRAR